MSASRAEISQRYRIADLVLDVGQRRVMRGGRPIKLSRQTFALLLVLAESAPNLLGHDQLASRAWGPKRVVTLENLSQHAGLLRRALGDDAAAPRYIEARRGEGYRLIPTVQRLGSDEPRAGTRRLAPTLMAIAATALVATAAVRFDIVLSIGSSSFTAPDFTGKGPSRPADTAVVVLPFRNESNDVEQEYFGDGLTEELMNQLGRIEHVRVISRLSSFAFKDRDASVAEIRRLLGVSHILEGSVYKDGERLRIAARLVDADRDRQIWSSSYERPLDDIFAIQNEIAAAVAEALSEEIGAGGAWPYGFGTEDPEAHDLALRARGLLRAGGPEETLRAEQLLRAAVAVDPSFLAARAELARTLDRIRFFVPGRAASALAEERALNRALIAEVPEHAGSYLLRGVEAWNRNEWREAERALAKARELAPPGELRAEAQRLASIILRTTGRDTEALEGVRALSRADPLSLERSYTLQRSLYVAGLLEDAEAEYARSRDLIGDRSLVETTALMRALVEHYPAEILELRIARFRDAAPQPELAPIRELLAIRDDRSAALELLRNEERKEEPSLPGIFSAYWADYFGDTELALAGLRRWLADTRRFDQVVWTPLLANTRRTPGFQDLLSDYGLLDYWRDSGHWGDYCRPRRDEKIECR